LNAQEPEGGARKDILEKKFLRVKLQPSNPKQIEGKALCQWKKNYTTHERERNFGKRNSCAGSCFEQCKGKNQKEEGQRFLTQKLTETQPKDRKGRGTVLKTPELKKARTSVEASIPERG